MSNKINTLQLNNEEKTNLLSELNGIRFKIANITEEKKNGVRKAIDKFTDNVTV